MTKSQTLKKKNITKSMVSKILKTVSYNSSFHFYTAIGQYTGETATSLVNFAKELGVIQIESVDFHFKRAEFQKWIRGTIGDAELATRMDQIEKGLAGERLRKKILEIVQARLSELARTR